MYPAAHRPRRIDPAKLASLAVNGATIRKIALRAAFLAAARGEPVTMDHLMDCSRRELRQSGRALRPEEVVGMAVTSTQLSCRIGTVRLPRTCPLDEAELAAMIELELGQLLRLVAGCAGHHRPRRAIAPSRRAAAASSPPAALARLIALEIHQRIQRGGMS